MLTYYFEGNLPRGILVLLEAQAQHLGLTLAEASDLSQGADLHFLAAGTSWKGKTGLRVAWGDGWTQDLINKHAIRAWPSQNEATPQLAHLLLSWANEQKQCREIRPLRHDLGNLVVIFLARISTLRSLKISINV